MKREDLSNAMKDDKQKIERVWKNKNKRAKKKKKGGRFNRFPIMPLQDQDSWLEALGAFGCVVSSHDHLVEY